MKTLRYLYIAVTESKAVAVTKLLAIAIGFALNFTKEPTEIINNTIESNVEMLMTQNDAFDDRCKRNAENTERLNNETTIDTQ